MAIDQLTMQAVSGITDPDQVRITLFINNQQVHVPLVDAVNVAAALGYLPLSGGTLTGPLNGTSATFSGAVGGAAATFTTGNFSGLLTSNGQISFPAVQNPSAGANVLDDYEEGATTPTVTAGTGTITTVSSTLNYTKIGRLVAFKAIITVTTNGTGAGFLILPLPFTASAINSPVSAILNATGAALIGNVAGGSANCNIFTLTGAYPATSGTVLSVNGTYFV